MTSWLTGGVLLAGGPSRQEDLAVQAAKHGLTLHPSAFAKIEAGVRALRLNEAVAITEALGMTFTQMLSTGREENWPPNSSA
jgi:hypothetical protein